jgi:hypothetical protein
LPINVGYERHPKQGCTSNDYKLAFGVCDDGYTEECDASIDNREMLWIYPGRKNREQQYSGEGIREQVNVSAGSL